MLKRDVSIYRSALEMAGGMAVTGFGDHHVTRAIHNRKLTDFAVVMVESGAGTLRTERAGVVPIKAPALFWLFPGRSHSYGPDAAGWDERWALFSGVLTRDFVRLRLMTEDQPVIQLSDPGEMQRLFSALHGEVLDDTVIGRAAAAATLHRIVVSAARQSVEAKARQHIPEIAQAVAALRQRAFDDVDLAGFADEFSMSSATLRRKFAQATGLSPKAFQLRLRLDRAKELLVSTDQPIEAVATAIGIQDAFYFSRLFQSREHCSPSQFRARNRRG